MGTRALFSSVLLTVLAFSASAIFAADMFAGVWKMNIAKSTGGTATTNTTQIVSVGNGIRLDGLAEYQESILPRLVRLETGFISSLKAAENGSGDWRAYYFENAHRQVKDILRAAKLSRPSAHVARTKHRQFIRYYELLDREFANVGVRLASNPNIDYVQQLR